MSGGKAEFDDRRKRAHFGHYGGGFDFLKAEGPLKRKPDSGQGSSFGDKLNSGP